MMKIKSLFRRGHQTSAGKTPPEGAPLKGATSVSSLDSKHHKIAPVPKDKSTKVFGSKDKINKSGKKDKHHPEIKLTPSNETLDEVDRAEEMEGEFNRPEVASLRRSRNNNKIEYSSADELTTTTENQLRIDGQESLLFKGKLSSSCRLERPSESLLPLGELDQPECNSLPPLLLSIPTVQEYNGTAEVSSISCCLIEISQFYYLFF